MSLYEGYPDNLLFETMGRKKNTTQYMELIVVMQKKTSIIKAPQSPEEPETQAPSVTSQVLGIILYTINTWYRTLYHQYMVLYSIPSILGEKYSILYQIKNSRYHPLLQLDDCCFVEVL